MLFKEEGSTKSYKNYIDGFRDIFKSIKKSGFDPSISKYHYHREDVFQMDLIG